MVPERKPHPEFVDVWRIRAVGDFTRERIDAGGRAVISFDRRGYGTLKFCGIEAEMDCRYIVRPRSNVVEFSLVGFEDAEPISGRGWAHVLRTGGMTGHLFLHRGSDLPFSAIRLRQRTRRKPAR